MRCPLPGSNRNLGKFITLEGGEGVGKSTLIQNLSQWLRSLSVKVVDTREPGGTAIADEMRKLFKNPPRGEVLCPQAEVLMVSAARAQHVNQVIKPALANGDWVISDRFADSTRVYQGFLGGTSFSEIEWLIEFSTGGLLPDITFLVDCDVDVSLARIKAGSSSRDEAARFDHAARDVHLRLRSGFRKVAGFFPNRFFILDGALPAEKVFESAKLEITRRWFDQ